MPLNLSAQQKTFRSNAKCVGAMAVALLVFNLACASFAQSNKPKDKPSLLEREPFDLIVLNASNDNVELEVFELPLPGRRVPRPFPSGSFEAREISNPTADLRVLWSAVSRIELYEEQLMNEALRLTKAKKYNQAFRYFARLDRDYTGYRGLNSALVTYLRSDALDQFRQGNHVHALAVLQSLYLRAKATPGVAQAVNAVSESILKSQWEANDYAAVRQTIDMLKVQFAGLDIAVVDRWSKRLNARLEQLIKSGEAFLSKDDFRQARVAATRAFNLSPNSSLANDLLERIEKANPSLRVGVNQSYYESYAPHLDSPVAIRTGRLLSTSLASMDDFQSSGGVYSSPFGEIYSEDSNEQIVIKLNPAADDQGQGGYRLSRAILDLVEENDPYFTALGSRLTGIEVRSSAEVVLQIDPPHPHPEALLKGPIQRSLLPYVPTRWTVTSADEESTIFTFKAMSPNTSDATEGGYRQLEELLYEKEEQGIKALLSGEIHALANVSPWNLPRLASSKVIRIGQYRIPTLHCLILSGDSWLVKERESRRGLCYSLARDTFVEEVLLAGENRSGFGSLSGPFPAGQSLSDPLRYAYQDSIASRSYEPRLAALLMALAAQGGAKNAMENELIDTKELPPLLLAHSPSPTARLACRSIQTQLKGLQVKVDLVELDEKTLLTEGEKYDLRYAEIRVGEPMVDVWPLIGPGGLAGECSESLIVALNQLNSADSSVTMTDRLRQIHEVAHGELPIVPLWQTVDHYAYRTDLDGLPDETVDLYQSIESWKINRRRRSR